MQSDRGKNKNNHRGGRRKSKSFKSESEEYDSLGSDSEAENSGTEQGVSSRTESSNQLDGPLSQSPGLVPGLSGSCSIQNKERSSSQLSRHRTRMHSKFFLKLGTVYIFLKVNVDNACYLSKNIQDNFEILQIYFR